MQAPLDAIAEETAQRLALADAVEQVQGGADARARQVHRERALVVRLAVVGKISATQNAGCGGMGEAGRVHETAPRLPVPVRLDLLQPAVAADR
jgi:hypothetical protein